MSIDVEALLARIAKHSYDHEMISVTAEEMAFIRRGGLLGRYKPNDGGPAFPSHGSMGEVAHEGMSLRDYFAVHAPGQVSCDAAEDARLRYRWADFMLEARK